MRRNIHNMHKKRRAIVLLLFMVMSLTMKAQVFMMEDEADGRVLAPAWVPNPQHSAPVDYYLPLGDGLLVLTCMGAAYLLKKKKTNNQ